MKLKPYPGYKDSGVEWIGEVPVDWHIHRLKYLISDLESGGRDKGGGRTLDEGIFSLGGEHINWDGTLNLKNSRFISEEYYNSMQSGKIKINDVLLVKDGATIGKTAIVEEMPTERMAVNEHVFIIRPNKHLAPKLLYYLISGDSGFKQIKLTETGSAQGGINLEFTAKVKVSIPQEINEQNLLVSFLDKKTSEIDLTIEKDTSLIELLKEKRTALINHVVTKGLDPTVKMKDSGVEWIGEIPENWEIGRMGSECSVKARLGWRGLKASEYVDEGYIFLSTPNIKEMDIDFENVNYISAERYFESPEIMLDVGDVLLAKDGSTLGISNAVRYLPAPATVNSSIAVIKPKYDVNSVYLHYFLSSAYMQNMIQRIKGGMGVPHLFQADIRKFRIFKPPISEQNSIADYIDRKTVEINFLIQKVQKKIDLLEEYKKSLIHHVVTGKVDVREVAV